MLAYLDQSWLNYKFQGGFMIKSTYLIDSGTTFESFATYEVGDFVEVEITDEHCDKEIVSGTIIEILE